MATKSILKNIKITDPSLARSMAIALESAEQKKYKTVQLTRRCTEITGEKIKEFLDFK